MKKGRAISNFQKDPTKAFSFFEKNGKTYCKPISYWGETLMKKGLGSSLRLQENYSDPARFQEILLTEVDNVIQIVVQSGNELSEDNNNENGYKICNFQFDIDLIELIVSDKSSSGELIRAISIPILKALSFNIEVDIVVNQFKMSGTEPLVATRGSAFEYDEAKFTRLIQNFKKLITKEIKLIIQDKELIKTSELSYQRSNLNPVPKPVIEINKIDADERIKISLIERRDISYYKNLIDEIVKKGESVFRFSVEWASIFPEEPRDSEPWVATQGSGTHYSPNQINQTEYTELTEIIRYASSKNIELTLCLHHMTWPVYIDWSEEKTVAIFLSYVENLLERLKTDKLLDNINNFIIFNESITEFSLYHCTYEWNPYVDNPKLSLRDALAGLVLTSELVRKLVPEKLIENNKLYRAAKNKEEATKKVAILLRDRYRTPNFGDSHSIMLVKSLRRFDPIGWIMSAIGKSYILGTFKSSQELIFSADLQSKKIFIQPYGFHYVGFSPRLSHSEKKTILQIPDHHTQESFETMKDIQANGRGLGVEMHLQTCYEVSTFILHKAIENSITDLSKLPKIVFSEGGGAFGTVSSSQFTNIIFDFVEKHKATVPLEIESYHFWTTDNDLEWSSGFDNAGFGLKHRDGRRKIEDKREFKIDMEDQHLHKAAKDLKSALEKYTNYLKSCYDLEARETKIRMEEVLKELELAHTAKGGPPLAEHIADGSSS